MAGAAADPCQKLDLPYKKLFAKSQPTVTAPGCNHTTPSPIQWQVVDPLQLIDTSSLHQQLNLIVTIVIFRVSAINPMSDPLRRNSWRVPVPTVRPPKTLVSSCRCCKQLPIALLPLWPPLATVKNTHFSQSVHSAWATPCPGHPPQGAGVVNDWRQWRPVRTFAAFAQCLPPAPRATAPVPRRGGHATVAAWVSATAAQTLMV